MTNAIFTIKQGKDYDFTQLGEVKSLATPGLVACVEYKQRLADFNSMSKSRRQKFLEEKQTDEVTWKTKVTDLGDLFIGKHTLTFEMYDAYCWHTNRRFPADQNWGRGTRPAVNISILDAIEYCNWINEYRGLGRTYILARISGDIWLWYYPGTNSEKTGGQLVKEQEVALNRKLSVQEKIDLVQYKCHQRIPISDQWLAVVNRPNETYKYPGSNNLKEVAWFSENSNGRTHPVGELKPNSYDVYDLYGNVWEMCLPEFPPVMTEEIWKANWPKIKYLDFSAENIFNVLPQE